MKRLQFRPAIDTVYAIALVCIIVIVGCLIGKDW